ncbi:MAG: putative Transglycosylase [Frankiales bacterium]|nr:putative Transglycosylase [Frankiales bacterium]
MVATAVRQRPVPRPAGRRPLWRRVLRTLLRAVVVVLVLGGLLLAGGWVLTPSVGDAADRVAAHLTVHGARALQGPVPARIAAALTATEDSRFWSTPGVDPLGLVR